MRRIWRHAQERQAAAGNAARVRHRERLRAEQAATRADAAAAEAAAAVRREQRLQDLAAQVTAVLLQSSRHAFCSQAAAQPSTVSVRMRATGEGSIEPETTHGD